MGNNLHLHAQDDQYIHSTIHAEIMYKNPNKMIIQVDFNIDFSRNICFTGTGIELLDLLARVFLSGPLSSLQGFAFPQSITFSKLVASDLWGPSRGR